MHKSVAEHSDLIPDEHEWIFRKQKSGDAANLLI